MNWRSERGSISIIMAISMLLLAGLAAVVIDLGLLHLTRRNLQAATDIAAMEAARKPADASARATTQLVNNGFRSRDLSRVVLGSWDRMQPAGARFVAGAAASASAVRVTSETQVPLFFGRIVTGNERATIRAEATASHVPLGAFEIGSGVASLNGGLVNAILGPLLGTTLSLDAVSYDGLLHTNVDALTFLDALAVKAGIAAGTYGDLANATVSVKNVLSALVTVLGDASASAASSAITATVNALATSASSGPVIKVGDLVDLQFWREQPVGASSGDSRLRGTASLNVFNLVTTAGQIGSPNTLINLPTALNIPGIATGTIRLALIEPTQATPPATTDSPRAVGPVGIKAATAQVRLAIDLTLLDLHYLKAVPLLGPLLTSLLNIQLPLYLDVAPAQGVLTAVSCGGDPLRDSTITVQATSGIARLSVGNVTSGSLTAAGPLSPPEGAALISILGLIKVNAAASAQAGEGGPTSLTFNATEIAAHTTKRISSGKTVSTLLTTLLTSLSKSSGGGLTIQVLTPVLTIDLGLLAAALGNTLSPVLSALDPILDQLLQVLGVQVGYADVTPLGVRCGIPALVN